MKGLSILASVALLWAGHSVPQKMRSAGIAPVTNRAQQGPESIRFASANPRPISSQPIQL